MPSIPSINKLDTDQRGVLDTLLRDRSSHWVRGFAGSGKSILLIHGVRELLIRRPGSTACMVAFTHSLKDMLKSGLPDSARHIPVVTYHEFRKSPKYYDYIFVDEVQDLEEDILSLLKDSSNVLVMAGDEEQSIFENRVVPDDIKRITQPAVHSLLSVYRLTEKLKKVVATILPGARVQSARNVRLAADVKLTLACASSKPEEHQWVWTEAKRATRVGEPVAILFPKKNLIKDFITSVCSVHEISAPTFSMVKQSRFPNVDYGEVNRYLAHNELELRYLGNGYGELEESDRQRIVYLMTYHSAKGLDFETVFLPDLNNGLKIWKDEDDMERRLFYVAATRSRRNLFISYSGSTPHRLVSGIPQDLVGRIEICPPSQASGGDDFDDVF